MKALRRFPLLASLLVAVATQAGAQTAPLELELGYRFVRVSGNADEYRSQIDDRPGLLLRNVSFATTDLAARTSFIDRFRVEGSDLGAGPAGSLRVEAGKAGLYALRFSYRHAELYSALPEFANPLFPTVIPGQHTFDRSRDTLDADLELLPGGWITPLAGYTRNSYSGPGRSTYTVGGDEFRLRQDLKDVDQEARIGAAFSAGPVSGRVVQGWRQFRQAETYSLAPGEGNGNNAGTLLGVPVDLTNLTRSDSTKTNTPSTSALVTARLVDRVRLVGSYRRASAESDTREAEDLAGNLVSFQIARFFSGLTETASTRARATAWRGSGRAEATVMDGVDLDVGWSRQHRTLDGFALVSTLYVGTVTFAGQDPRNLLQLLQANTAMDRTVETFEATASARGLGPVSARLGWSRTRQDVTVTPDLSEIVIPGGQGGDFERHVTSWNAGATYTRAPLTFTAEYQRERADDPILRTDFLDRDRYKIRLGWSEKGLLHVSATGEQIDSSNDRPGIAYDATIREYGGDLEITPVKAFRARFSAIEYDATSTLLFRVPQDFSTATSFHREKGLSLEGGISLALPQVTLDGSYMVFTNRGSYSFTIDRARAAADVPVNAHVAILAEWMRDKYNDVAQNLGNLGKFAANRVGLYIRWRN